MAALVAAAIDREAIGGVELNGSLASLKQLIETDKTVEELPELFAFGLLTEFDVRHLVALAAPLPVSFSSRTERCAPRTGWLIAWYGLFDADLRPDAVDVPVNRGGLPDGSRPKNRPAARLHASIHVANVHPFCGPG